MSTNPAVAVVVTEYPSECTPGIKNEYPYVEGHDDEEEDDDDEDEEEPLFIPPIIDYSNPKMPYGFTQMISRKHYVKGLRKRRVSFEDFTLYFLYKGTYKNTKDMASFECDIEGMLFDIATEEYAKRHAKYLLSQKKEEKKL